MFSSDKDLRKPIPKRGPVARPQKPQGVGPKAATPHQVSQDPTANFVPAINSVVPQDIIEVAKQERENRALLREKAAHVLRIQAWWRGTRSAKVHFSTLRKEIRTKLDDIEKIVRVFEEKGSGAFVTPAAIGWALVKQVLVLGKDMHSGDLVARLCRLVVLVGATELDPTKNLVVYAHKLDASLGTLVRFYLLCLRTLLPTPVKSTTRPSRKGGASPHPQTEAAAKDQGSISQALQALVGAHAPFKMKYSAELDGAFLSMRRVLSTRHGGLALFRAYFMKKCVPLHNTIASGDTLSGGSQRVGNSARPKVSSDNDLIFALCLFLVEKEAEARPSSTGDAVRQLVYHIFSVPMLTMLLTTDTLRAFQRWSLFHALLQLMADPAGVQCPPAPLEGPSALKVISTGQWVLGNLTSLAPVVVARMLPSPTAQIQKEECFHITAAVELAPEDLVLYLDVCSAWLSSFAMSDILQGRSGIFWQQQGTNSIAVAVPSGLEEQIVSLLHPSVLGELDRRAIGPVATPLEAALAPPSGVDPGAAVKDQWTSSFGLAEDVKDVTEALASSAYVIAHATLKDHQEASTWFTAKWAKKITSTISTSLGFSSALSSSSAPKSSAKSGASCSGGKSGATEHRSVKASAAAEDSKLVFAVCSLWAILLPSAANAAPDSLPWKALSQLAFSGPLVPRLWCFLLHQTRGDLAGLAKSFSVRAGEVRPTHAQRLDVLFSLVAVLRMVLIVLDDSELYEDGRPLPLHQLLRLVRCLKMILFKVLRDDHSLLTDVKAGTASSSASAGEEAHGTRVAAERRQLHLAMRSVVSVLADLYSRWARRPFSSAALWEIKEAGGKAVLAEVTGRTPFGHTLLRVMPWAVDFHERMTHFRAVVDAERLQVQGSNDAFSGPQRSRGVVVRVRKARILEDGMEALARVGGAIKDRIVVKYVNDFGEEEAGIDAGGLFKDFVTDLSGRIFDPSYGLFCTTSTNLMYPNPSAALLFDPHEMDSMFVFLGRVLGKALFENITLQPQFAHFFLAFMHGKYNFMNLINDLNTLDPELYKNLMFLKTYDGDIADLGLTFSVTDTSMGGQKEVELLPGGANMDVTTQNRHRYINLAAKYYLHDRLKRQAKAFFSGLYQVVQPELLQMFCAPELQILISGSQAGLSVADLRQYTRYAGGYISLDTHMTRFWGVFAELSAEDQALLLKFVTSCERPPSLGFASLQPPFTIQKVDCSDDQRLPTASTCFNILKLPTYSSARVMKEKLLQSIRARAGFDLS